MFKRKKEADHEHRVINVKLEDQERELERMARRVKILEIEAGIYKPNLREVNGE